MNVVKKFLTPLLIGNKEFWRGETSLWVIKRNNNFMSLSTDTLKILDITNYLAHKGYLSLRIYG